jgi:hypothetical protein
MKILHQQAGDLGAAWLLPHLPGRLIVDLEAFRYKHDLQNGPTNLAEVYISQYPIECQLELYNQDKALFWNRHPAYARAFWLQEAQEAKREGRLDEVPDYVIDAYMEILRGNKQFRRGYSLVTVSLWYHVSAFSS